MDALQRRRTPQGVRGLKSLPGVTVSLVSPGRTPQGVRGLKCPWRS